MLAVPQTSLVRDAYERGKESAYHGFPRASPYYEEKVLIHHKRIDITPLLDAFWYAGFDGEPYPDKPEEVKADALDLAPDPLSVVEGITADQLAKRQNESGVAPESATGARQEGAGGTGAGKDGA